MVGVIDDSGRRFGAIVLTSPLVTPDWFGTPAFASKSSISSFSTKPPPSTTTPEPNGPFSVYVFETALPHLSTTEKCVVCAFSGIESPRPGLMGAAPSTSSGVMSSTRFAR